MAPRHDQPDGSRILVTLPNWVGDIVLATPSLRALRDQFPSAYLSALIRPHLRPLLAGADWMNEVLTWPAGGTRSSRRRSFLGLAQDIRDRGFDTAVLMPNSFRSALLARLAGIPRRVGYDRDGRGLLLTDRLLADKRDGKYMPVSMLVYYGALVRYLGVRALPNRPELYTTPEEEADVDRWFAEFGFADEASPIVINPGGSYGPAKFWPCERFAVVADELHEAYGAPIVINCGPGELAIGSAVRDAMKGKAALLHPPRSTLGGIKALIKRSRLVVTNDTGPRHFAIAFGVPVVTIFGPTHPEWTETNCPHERKVMVKVHCGPCQKRVCPLDHRCMTRIGPERVIAAARELLEAKAAPLA